MPTDTLNNAGDAAAEGLLYLEDLRVGQRFTSGSHALDEGQIKTFAAQFDPQPFHLDGHAARSSFLEGLAASGWHTAAITMRLLVGGGIPLAGGVVGAGGEIRWPRPTRPDDILQVESEILEVRPSRSKPDRGLVTVRSETRNQHGEVVQFLIAKLVVPRRPVPDVQSGAPGAVSWAASPSTGTATVRQPQSSCSKAYPVRFTFP